MMTHDNDTSYVDLISVEREARQMRADTIAQGVNGLLSRAKALWTGRRRPQGRTA